MSPQNPNELEPDLARAKSTLKTALGEACGSDVDSVDTGELIRIDEVLALASDAAKEAISIRRRLRADHDSHSGAVDVEAEGPGSRDIEDAAGTRWTVFAVYPPATTSPLAISEPYRNGWLSFDGGTETRRLTPIPADWRTMSDEDLLGLCASAEPARRRPSVRRQGDEPRT